jgi:hypothetical protein
MAGRFHCGKFIIMSFLVVCLGLPRMRRPSGNAVAAEAKLGGQPTEQDVESAVEFGKTVIGGPGWGEVS